MKNYKKDAGFKKQIESIIINQIDSSFLYIQLFSSINYVIERL